MKGNGKTTLGMAQENIHGLILIHHLKANGNRVMGQGSANININPEMNTLVSLLISTEMEKVN